MTIEEFHQEEFVEEKFFPSVMNRVQALFFDFWFLVGITLLLTYVFNVLLEADVQKTLLKIIVFCSLLLIYEPIFNMTGGTIGYRTMGMRLKRYESPGKNISLRQAYLRFFMKICLGWVSLISISTDPLKRAFHDKMSGTIVLIAKIKLH